MTHIGSSLELEERSVACLYGWGAKGRYVLEDKPLETLGEELPWLIGPFIREVSAEEINLKRHLLSGLRQTAYLEDGLPGRGIIDPWNASQTLEPNVKAQNLGSFPSFEPSDNSPLVEKTALREFVNLYKLPGGACASLAERYGTLADHSLETGIIYESVRAWKCESFLAWAALLVLKCKTNKQWEEDIRSLLLKQYKNFCADVPRLSPSDLSKIPSNFQSHFYACFDQTNPRFNHSMYLHIPALEEWWLYLIGEERFDKTKELVVRIMNSRIRLNCRAGLLYNGKPILDPRLHLPERAEGSMVDTFSPTLIASNLCGAIWLRIANKYSKEPFLEKFCLHCGSLFEPNPRQCKYCRECRKGIGRKSNASAACEYRRRQKEKKEREISGAETMARLKKLAEDRKQERSNRKPPSRILIADD